MPDNRCATPWVLTAHIVKARTINEAQSQLRRRFSKCGFTAMSLVAVLDGNDPNTTPTDQSKQR